jgi:hypothetical protein
MSTNLFTDFEIYPCKKNLRNCANVAKNQVNNRAKRGYFQEEMIFKKA